MFKQIIKASVLLGLCWVALFISTQPVYADTFTVTYTDTIELQRTDWSSSMMFPKFDSTLGVLTGIEFTLEGTLEGSARFESLDSQATTVIIGMSAQVDLQRPDGSVITGATPAAEATAEVTSFDGVVDYGGTSGGVFERLIGIDVTETDVLVSSTDLLLFTGAGNIELPVGAVGTANGEGAGNLALSYRTTAAANVKVTYFYTLPAVTLKKFTNGEDADVGPGPLIQENGAVSWTYIITNTGDVDLVELELIDDKEGAILTCPNTTLAVGASMTCTLTGVAKTGQYTNTATVTGKTPDDGVNPQRTVTASDPSHYFGTPIAICPTDNGSVTALPEVEYLGQGGGTYLLPTGFDAFIIKRHVPPYPGRPLPFRFDVEPGTTNNAGEIVYISPNKRNVERIWACAGQCDFTPFFDGLLPLGFLTPGVTVGAVVIDDDLDHRINAWVADGNVNPPHATIDNQQMAETLFLPIPFAAEWGFLAIDSIGIVEICLTTNQAQGLLVNTGNGSAAPMAEELAYAAAKVTMTDSRIYLPAIYREE